MAKLNRFDTWTEKLSEKFGASYWRERIESRIPGLPVGENNLDEHQIWKNALLVEILTKSHSK